MKTRYLGNSGLEVSAVGLEPLFPILEELGIGFVAFFSNGKQLFDRKVQQGHVL